MDSGRTRHAVLAESDQPVSFAELFFDLVFVYCITQVVHLMHGVFDLAHVGKSLLVFWLVWWAWTQFTWALNAANTNHPFVQLGTLVATSIAFFMAVTLPDSFTYNSFNFALSYVAVRSIGLLIYLWVTGGNPAMRHAVKMFSLFSVAGLIAVLAGGFIGGKYVYWLWGLAIVLDVIAATIGAKSESWNLFPRHFTERHGLFVIIALGETLIIAAGGVTDEFNNAALLIVSLLSIGITCCLWWLYFFKTKDRLEHEMARRDGAERSTMARDVFSLIHFPLLCGLIIYAFAIEEAMLHPLGEMSEAARVALACGVLVYAGALTFAVWRASGKMRFSITTGCLLVAALIYLTTGISTIATMTIAFGGLAVICVIEELLDLP